MESSKTVAKRDWEGILATMRFYHRYDGYVDFVGDRFTFFDGDPCFDGVGALYVTLEDVQSFIDRYK